MVSPLSPQQFQTPQTVDLPGAFLNGQRMAQGNQLQQQNITENQQQISKADYDQATQRLGVINKLATKVRELPSQQRYSFVQSINPQMLQSVGIDPAQISTVQLDDNSLDALIAQTGAAAPSATPFRKESVNTSSGLQVFDPSTGTYKAATDAGGKPLTGAAYDPTLQGQISTAKQAGLNNSDLALKPKIAAATDTAKANVELATKPGIEAATTAAKTDAEISSKKEAEAKANLPALEDTTDNLNRYVDELKKHPGRKFSTGLYSAIPVLPGSPQADFKSRLEQINGGTFLQQYASLKGGGAITDIEGKKAEAAANRISAATSDAEFDKAVDDFKGILNQTLTRAKEQASGRKSSPSSSANDSKSRINQLRKDLGI